MVPWVALSARHHFFPVLMKQAPGSGEEKKA